MRHTRLYEIRDHSGQWMPLAFPGPGEDTAIDSSEQADRSELVSLQIRLAARAQALNESSWRARTVILVAFILIGLIAFGADVLLVRTFLRTHLPSFVNPIYAKIGGFLAAGTCMIFSTRLARFSDRRRIISVFVRECLDKRICPSCGYCIADLRSNDSKLFGCPECGAHWMLPFEDQSKGVAVNSA